MAVDPDRFDQSWSYRSLDLDMEGSHQQGTSRAGMDGSGKGEVLVCDDINIADLLPVDPFGMDIKSTVTGIKGWFQDADEDFWFNFDEFWINEVENDTDDDRSLAGPDWFFNGAVSPQPQKGMYSFDELEISRCWDFGELDSANNWFDSDEGKELQNDGEDPHFALFLALGYLEVKDLVAVEGVCRSLRDAVRGDPLLWRSLKIKRPFSLKITDDVLAKLARRAQGTLECLSLMDCIKVTDKGIKQVLDTNPRLAKLSVPGCMRLTINGILNNLRFLQFTGTLKVKHLRIGGVGRVYQSDFEELKSLLGADKILQLRPNKPHFFHWGPVYLSCDDDRPIDVEPCPICQRIGLIYDCPAESCQDKSNQMCRACTLCIPRCIQCGCCIKDRDYEETFFFDLICLDCLEELLCLENRKVRGCFIWTNLLTS